MKNHCWENNESVFLTICYTFNFEINLCHIYDSCICNVLTCLDGFHELQLYPASLHSC